MGQGLANGQDPEKNHTATALSFIKASRGPKTFEGLLRSEI
jgi:hypothetical protein